jgi:hypothetical protein
MAIKWWQWRNIQEKLRLYGRAVQGVDPYRIEFADEPGLTGITDFEQRLVRVNPELVPGLRPRQAYDITKAVLCHEAGHRRFTTPTRLSPVVHMVSNILEDQRIESLIMEEFAGTRALIWELTKALYDRSPDLEAIDDPGQVVAAALQYRWGYRLGMPLKGMLSTGNQAKWDEVRPLVEKAWVADSSLKVDRIARRIVQILGLKEHEVPAWVVQMLDRCKGARRRSDPAEGKAPSAPKPFGPGDAPSPRSEAFDGELLPDGHKEGFGGSPIEPKPYLDLETRAAPLAKELIEELELDPVNEEPEPAERGGRLSVRQYLRERDRPFLAADDDSLKPPALAISVVVDHSTSMNTSRGAGRTRIESVAEGAMVLHLACTALGIEHVVSVTPQQTDLATLNTAERGKALIAGLIPAQTGHENIAVALERQSADLLRIPADVRLLLVLHDGYPNDGEKAKKLCAELRGKVEVIGVLLDPDVGTENAMREMFGADRLIACKSKNLPKKMAAMLQSVRGI